MRFHLVSLPHTQTTAEYNNCAFAQLTRRFAMMMTSLGHEVYIYSGEDNDTPCTEHISCITKKEQEKKFNVKSPNDILKPPFVYETYDPSKSWWRFWNDRVIKAMRTRVQPKDFICLIGGGILFERLISAFPQTIAVEYAIGYGGIASRTHHCYGSSNWQHVVFGLQRYKDWRGQFYDRWIPHYFDPAEFTFNEDKEGYLLYLGKLKEDKGILVASQAAQEAGREIIFAGQGPTPIPYGEVRNRYINVEERRELLAGASALMVPSLYVEPFGMIAVEGLLSGTPIITTPWGGLGEINDHGVTGYQCHTLQDFVDAVNNIDGIDPKAAYDKGMTYDMDRLKHDYQRWFDDLYQLWGEGWYTLNRKEEKDAG